MLGARQPAHDRVLGRQPGRAGATSRRRRVAGLRAARAAARGPGERGGHAGRGEAGVLAAAKEQTSGRLVDRYLSDEQWRDIAQEFMHRLGLAPRGDSGGVRWVAIRHADDHVHVVATLARLDGKRASTHGDYLRSRQACSYIEAKYGLVPTSPAAWTAATHPTQAEKHNSPWGSDSTRSNVPWHANWLSAYRFPESMTKPSSSHVGSR